MISINLSKLAKMCGGTLVNSTLDVEVTGIYINTRTHKNEEIFLPIVGENFDGHHYVKDAFNQGARVSLFEENKDYSLITKPLILVKNTTQALALLAKNYLLHINPKTIAVTGSNGKTSTKDILSSLLDPFYNVTKTQGNRNNEIGLPLTILESTDDVDCFVLEMGMSSLGEIDILGDIAPPDVAIITSIGNAHLNDLGSLDNIILAKCEIIKHIKPNGTLVVNGDHKRFMEILKEQLNGQNVITYGFEKHNDYVIESVHQFIDSIVFDVPKLCEQPLVVSLMGQHQALNALGALLAARQLHLPLDPLIEKLKNIEQSHRRNEMIRVNQALIIDDSYKSNPEALSESLKFISNYPSDARKIVVLADMLDLGENEVIFHQDISKMINTLNIDRVYTLGKLAQHFHDFHHKVASHFETKEELLEALKPWLHQECIILFKGANAYGLFDIVDALRTLEK